MPDEYRPTLPEYWDALHRHDWFYSYSDDHSVWQRGRDAETRLRSASRLTDRHEDLWTSFRAHHFSGPSYGTEKQPLPERPSE